MKYKNDDRVVVISSENDTLIGKHGKIIEVDPDWIFPYEIEFDDNELNGGDCETLFAESDIILESEYMKRYDVEPVAVESDGMVLATDLPLITITPSSDIITDIRNLVERIKKEYPQCREASLAITKLDEARLWLGDIK